MFNCKRHCLVTATTLGVGMVDLKHLTSISTTLLGWRSSLRPPSPPTPTPSPQFYGALCYASSLPLDLPIVHRELYLRLRVDMKLVCGIGAYIWPSSLQINVYNTKSRLFLFVWIRPGECVVKEKRNNWLSKRIFLCWGFCKYWHVTFMFLRFIRCWRSFCSFISVGELPVAFSLSQSEAFHAKISRGIFEVKLVRRQLQRFSRQNSTNAHLSICFPTLSSTALKGSSISFQQQRQVKLAF